MWEGSQSQVTDSTSAKFIAAAGHHLRQPVQSLMLFLPLLKQQAGDVRMQAITRHMEDAVEGLARLLDDLSEIAQLESGIVAAAPQDFSPDDLLHRLAGEYGRLARRKSIGFRMVRTSRRIHADPVFVERVLRILIDNAVYHTKTGAVLVGCRYRREAVRINVVDTGIGIAPDQHRAIFEDFHQVESGARDGASGFGLGLGLARRIADLLGGTVTMTSRLGRGSCFTLTLPNALSN